MTQHESKSHPQAKKWPRVVDLQTGTVMVVTDLHGDWDAYRRYRDRFLQLQANGEADYLILNGDLIHRTGPPEEDRSLEMVLDVLALQETLGDRLIYLFGNHELPHVYNIPLQKRKGNYLYSGPFEAAMGTHRSRILELFDSLPFYVRTKAGVSICHAGGTPALLQPNGAARLFNFSHQKIWQEAEEAAPPEKRPSLRRAIAKMSNQSYDKLVRAYFAVSSPDDPRYDNYVIGTVAANSHPDFDLLWEAMFSRNELQYGERMYLPMLEKLLGALSADYEVQNVLVTGHIDCEGGYTLVDEQQLRLASAKHAQPREAGLYLLFDAGGQMETAVELLPGLDSVFK